MDRFSDWFGNAFEWHQCSTLSIHRTCFSSRIIYLSIAPHLTIYFFFSLSLSPSLFSFWSLSKINEIYKSQVESLYWDSICINLRSSIRAVTKPISICCAPCISKRLWRLSTAWIAMQAKEIDEEAAEDTTPKFKDMRYFCFFALLSRYSLQLIARTFGILNTERSFISISKYDHSMFDLWRNKSCGNVVFWKTINILIVLYKSFPSSPVIKFRTSFACNFHKSVLCFYLDFKNLCVSRTIMFSSEFILRNWKKLLLPLGNNAVLLCCVNVAQMLHVCSCLLFNERSPLVQQSVKNCLFSRVASMDSVYHLGVSNEQVKIFHHYKLAFGSLSFRNECFHI